MVAVDTVCADSACRAVAVSVGIVWKAVAVSDSSVECRPVVVDP